MKRMFALSLMALLFLATGCSTQKAPEPPAPPPRIPTWTMTGLLKEWLITPCDLVIQGQEIFVSGNFEGRVAVLNLNGQLLRYYAVEKRSEYDNVCVAVSAQGRVLAASSRGVWELMPDGTTSKLISLSQNIDHLTVGPDDNLYISSRSSEKSKILKMSLTGASSDFLTVDSNRISDLAFDRNGDLFMADAQNGRILKYSPAQGVQVFSSGFPAPGSHGGGTIYMDFDPAGRLYISSVWTRLALVSPDGKITPLDITNINGDLAFHEGLLYTTDMYDSKLFEIRIDSTSVLSKRTLLDGVTPRYIDHDGERIVGQRANPAGQQFFNFNIAQPGMVESNELLNTLQPTQYTFDGAGNIFVLFRNVLKKLDPVGREAFSVTLPYTFQWDTRIHYNPADDKIYFFDVASNSVIRANAQGAEPYHRFLATVSKTYLSITRDGKIFAGIISTNGATVVDISNSAQEQAVWSPSATVVVMLHVGTDAQGNLYAALGPQFQNVFRIDPATHSAVSVFGNSPSRYDWGFVDIQGFTVTDSGTVVLSAPGVLVKFVPDP